MKLSIFALTFSICVLFFVMLKGLVGCNNAIEPQPEIVPIDTLIAADSVDTLLLIRTNKKDSTE